MVLENQRGAQVERVVPTVLIVSGSDYPFYSKLDEVLPPGSFASAASPFAVCRKSGIASCAPHYRHRERSHACVHERHSPDPSGDIFGLVFVFSPGGLEAPGLVLGKTLGIDATTLESNGR